MALRPGDKKLIETVSEKLRIAENQYQESACYSSVDVDGRAYATHDRPRVLITKDDLKEASGRNHVRKSYQKDIVRELNNQMGVSAHLDGNRIYAESIPLRSVVLDAMSLADLKGLKDDEDF